MKKKLKSKFLLLLFIPVLLFVSCGEDSDDNTDGNHSSQTADSSNTTTNNDNPTDTNAAQTENSFSQFDETISFSEGTSFNDISKKILSLTGDTTIALNGAINALYLKSIADAMNENDSVKIALDLSKTTGITEMKSDYFKDCGTLYSINIPSTVTAISESAFKACESLVSIKIPDSVTKIGTGAFDDCSNLKNLVIPDSVESFDCNISGVYFDNLSIGSGLKDLGDCWVEAENIYINSNFKRLHFGTNVVVGDNVTQIEDSAFMESLRETTRKQLKSIKLGKGIAKIGKNAFYGCNYLTKIEYSSGITEIGNYAFFYQGDTEYDDWKKRKPESRSVYYNGTQEEFIDEWMTYNWLAKPISDNNERYADLYINGELVKNLVVSTACSEEETKYDKGSFSLDGCTSLESLVYAGYQLGDFTGCTKLTEVIFYGWRSGALPDSLEKFTYTITLNDIKSYFDDETAIENLKKLAGLNYNAIINSATLFNNGALKEVYFPIDVDFYTGSRYSYSMKDSNGSNELNDSCEIGPFRFSSDGEKNLKMFFDSSIAIDEYKNHIWSYISIRKVASISRTF